MSINRETARKYVADLNAGELSEEKKRELKAFMKEHPEFKREFKQYKEIWKRLDVIEQEAAHLYEESSFSSPDALKTNDAFQSTLEEVSSPRSDRTKNGRLRRRRSRRTAGARNGTPWKTIGIAASLLIAVLFGWITINDTTSKKQQPAQSIATLEYASKKLVLERSKEQIQVKQGMKLRQDDLLKVPVDGRAEFRYMDEKTRIELEGGTQVSVRNEENTKRIELKQGTLHADVAEQKPGEKLVADSPLSRAEIIGTKFTLSYDQKSRLEVTEGTVKFTASKTGEFVFVKQEEYAEIGPETELRHGSLKENEKPAKPEDPENRPPVADAGSDRTLRDQDGDGGEQVPLDASLSSDPDGTIVEYIWKENGKTIGSGKSPEISFKTGTHNVTLRVKDDQGSSDRDRVTVRVEKFPALEEGLIGHWTFDETTGTVVTDQSPLGNDGTLFGDPTWTETGKQGGALQFDGEDDYVKIPHVEEYLLDRGTVSLWFNADHFENPQQLLSKDSEGFDTGGHLLLSLMREDLLTVRLQDTKTGHFVRHRGRFSSDQWNHIALNWGPSGLQLYVNGERVGKKTYEGGLGTSSGGKGNFEPIVIGGSQGRSDDRSATPLSEFYSGLIDDVRLYDRVLSASEIETLAK